MDKASTLESILNAKKAHLAQMQKIDIAINGGDVNSPTVVDKRECSFGRWLYDEDSNLEKVLGPLFFNKLESYHSRWHDEYRKVFEPLFNKEEKKSFFSKFTGSSKISDMDLDRVKAYYSDLEITTKELTQAIDASHRRLMALQESKFE